VRGSKSEVTERVRLRVGSDRGCPQGEVDRIGRRGVPGACEKGLRALATPATQVHSSERKNRQGRLSGSRGPGCRRRIKRGVDPSNRGHLQHSLRGLHRLAPGVCRASGLDQRADDTGRMFGHQLQIATYPEIAAPKSPILPRESEVARTDNAHRQPWQGTQSYNAVLQRSSKTRDEEIRGRTKTTQKAPRQRG
jgi:hypothetical protein